MAKLQKPFSSDRHGGAADAWGFLAIFFRRLRSNLKSNYTVEIS